MKLRLVKADDRNKDLICDMLDEWYATGEKIVPYAIRRLDYHDYETYYRNIDTDNNHGHVATSTWFALDEERNIMVGAVNIRHYLNEQLLLDGGHIGDGIRPSERRKGYATEMIRLALEKCRLLGIFRILMVCDKDNIGSARSIRNNGGVLEDEPVVDGVQIQRYWITLEPSKQPQQLIRRMSIEEIPKCVEVIRASFQTVADEFGFTADNAPRFTAFATDENRLLYQFCVERRPMYVYSVDETIVGYYSLQFADEANAELGNLSVLPEWRHKGIGAKLLTDALLQTRSAGRSKLKLAIVEENRRLRNWYEFFGFVHTETKKFDFFPFTCGYLERSVPSTVYYRVHSADIAWITKQPRGVFTAVWRIIDSGVTTEAEAAEYWKNREYFEKALPLPPFYANDNPDCAVTWFKDTPDGNRIWEEMSFYRAMAEKYGPQLYVSTAAELPGYLVYEDGFQVAVKGQNEGVTVITKPLV